MPTDLLADNPPTTSQPRDLLADNPPPAAPRDLLENHPNAPKDLLAGHPNAPRDLLTGAMPTAPAPVTAQPPAVDNITPQSEAIANEANRRIASDPFARAGLPVPTAEKAVDTEAAIKAAGVNRKPSDSDAQIGAKLAATGNPAANFVDAGMGAAFPPTTPDGATIPADTNRTSGKLGVLAQGLAPIMAAGAANPIAGAAVAYHQGRSSVEADTIARLRQQHPEMSDEDIKARAQAYGTAAGAGQAALSLIPGGRALSRGISPIIHSVLTNAGFEGIQQAAEYFASGKPFDSEAIRNAGGLGGVFGVAHSVIHSLFNGNPPPETLKALDAAKDDPNKMQAVVDQAKDRSQGDQNAARIPSEAGSDVIQSGKSAGVPVVGGGGQGEANSRPNVQADGAGQILRNAEPGSGESESAAARGVVPPLPEPVNQQAYQPRDLLAAMPTDSPANRQSDTAQPKAGEDSTPIPAPQQAAETTPAQNQEPLGTARSNQSDENRQSPSTPQTSQVQTDQAPSTASGQDRSGDGVSLVDRTSPESTTPATSEKPITDADLPARAPTKGQSFDPLAPVVTDEEKAALFGKGEESSSEKSAMQGAGPAPIDQPKAGDMFGSGLKSKDPSDAALADAAKWLNEQGGAKNRMDAAKMLTGEFGREALQHATKIWRMASQEPPPPTPRGRAGAVAIPDIVDRAATATLADTRAVRERFAKIEQYDSPALARDFTKNVTVPTQAESLMKTMERRTGADEDTLSKLKDIGQDNRRQELQAKGLPASKLTDLSPADAAAYRADPKVKAAMDWWNKNIRPTIDDIRTRNGLPMSKAGAASDFFVNLPSEPGVGGGRAGVNNADAFNKAAVGEGDYNSDPREFFKSIIQQHLRVDAANQLANTIKRDAVIPNANVVDPLAKLNPASTTFNPKGRSFTAQYRGRTEDVALVDLAKPDAKVPDLQYVPSRVAKQWENVYQNAPSDDSLAGKIRAVPVAMATTGVIAPHTARILYHVGSRMAESGQSDLTLAPWFGSPVAAATRMIQLRDSLFGDTLQNLIDRSGSDKGSGYGVQEESQTKNLLMKVLNAPHEALFNPKGIDPTARKVVGETYLRTLLGHDAVDKIESDVNAGRSTPLDASRQIEKSMKANEFLQFARHINGTLGFANKQTRGETLNNLSYIFPFISSESGMIPREMTKLATMGINAPALGRNVSAGRYGAAVKQMATMLTAGAIGTYIAQNGVNYAMTKWQNGQGKFMYQNPEGHKADIQLAPGTFWSNADPTISRAARLLGIKAAMNGKPVASSAALGNLNEAIATLNPALHMMFSAFSGKAAYVGDKGDLYPAKPSDMIPLGAGRNLMDKALNRDGKDKDSYGSAAAKDVAAAAGVNLSTTQPKPPASHPVTLLPNGNQRAARQRKSTP